MEKGLDQTFINLFSLNIEHLNLEELTKFEDNTYPLVISIVKIFNQFSLIIGIKSKAIRQKEVLKHNLLLLLETVS